VPKVGSLVNHRLYAAGIRAELGSLLSSFPADVILRAWAYPDGCAVARLAAEHNFPFALIAQGTDVHRYLHMPIRRRLIVRACDRAGTVITRSQDLARQLAAAGVPSGKLHPIPNGVDLDLFAPADRQEARQALGLPLQATIVLFVGSFFPVKNPLLLLEAHALLCREHTERTWTLAMVGDGPLRKRVLRQARRRGLQDQVILAGEERPAEVARYMQAADVLCVPSNNEGLPNVIREALACGLRVVATRVGGIPEVVTEPCLGQLVERGNAQALAEALEEVVARPRESDRIRRYAEQFSWNRTAAEHAAILAGLGGGGSGKAAD